MFMRSLLLFLILTSCRMNTDNINQDSNIQDTISKRETYKIIGQSNNDLSLLNQVTQQSIEKFQSVFGTIDNPIILDVSGSNCLRVGYNYKEKIVKFCNTSNVINQGLASKDVISHELFHALICAKYPSFCSNDEIAKENSAAIHEGLADYFSYLINSDNYFGENFYKDQNFIRNYKTLFCFNLTPGSHGKGMTIVSELISHQINLSDIKSHLDSYGLNIEKLLLTSCFQTNGPQINYIPKPNSASTLHRYRIIKNQALEIQFEPNASLLEIYPNINISWQYDKPEDHKFEFKENEKFKYLILPIAEDGWSKIFAVFKNGSDIIGSQVFYFTIDHE